MGRLINTDALEAVSWSATGKKEYDEGFADGVIFIIEKIDNAPAVEAIPVEWIKKIKGAGVDHMHCAGVILGLWKKEQEENEHKNEL